MWIKISQNFIDEAILTSDRQKPEFKQKPKDKAFQNPNSNCFSVKLLVFSSEERFSSGSQVTTQRL
jgi:hypothetical protein